MRIAVVTGSNKGIGLATVKQLAGTLGDNGTVYLTSRDEARGLEAVQKLRKDGIEVKYHQLDISDKESCQRLHDDLKPTGIDILINNAATAFPNHSTEPKGNQAEVTVTLNYFKTKEFCDIIFPILNKNARVVNLSSFLGHLSCIKGEEPQTVQLRGVLADPNISIQKLDELAHDYIDRMKNNTYADAGWPSQTYSVSKVLVSVLTRIQQREMDAARPNDNILINCVHPGYVITDMTGQRGNFTTERGAQSPVWAGLIPEAKTEPRGKYIWHDNTLVDFTADKYPDNI